MELSERQRDKLTNLLAEVGEERIYHHTANRLMEPDENNESTTVDYDKYVHRIKKIMEVKND